VIHKRFVAVVKMSRPAVIPTLSGRKGLSPAAIRSAFTNSGQSPSPGKNSEAKVVLPAPFGPAIMRIRFIVVCDSI